MSSDQITRALEDAITEIQRCETLGWGQYHGVPVSPKLERLKRTLQGALAEHRSSGITDPSPLRGLVKWVSDWIPDLDDPLLQQLGNLEDALR